MPGPIFAAPGVGGGVVDALTGQEMGIQYRGPFRHFMVGVSEHVGWGQTTSAVTTMLKRHLADGITLIRSDLSWKLVETADGTYDDAEWARYDNAVEQTALNGQYLIFSIMETPDWALASGTDKFEPPADLQKYADFCAVVAERYRSAKHVAIAYWNEFSLFGDGASSGFWHPVGIPTGSGWAADATIAANVAADMMVLAYKAVREVAPNMPLVGASLHESSPAFLEKIYQRLDANHDGIRPWDVVDVHPYRSNKGPRDSTHATGTLKQGLLDVYAVMSDYKDHSEIWCLEMGWNSGVSAAAPLTGADDAARDLLRATYFEQALEDLRDLPFVRCMCLFTTSTAEAFDADYDFHLYKSGANTAGYNTILSKWRSMMGGRVAAHAVVSVAGVAIASHATNWQVPNMNGTDLEDTDNTHFSSASNITGTVARTSGSATITGTGTAFLTELSPHQLLLIAGTLHTVVEIASDTSMTVTPVPSGTSSGLAAQRRSDGISIKYPGPYVNSANGAFPPNASGTIRGARLMLLSGGTVTQLAIDTSGKLHASIVASWNLSVRRVLKKYDIIYLELIQDSGSALTVNVANSGVTSGLSVVREAPLPW